MKVGLSLPYSRVDPSSVLEMVDVAEAGGVDGVFVSDHLWRPGGSEGPTLSAFPYLGAIAARTSRIHVGTLVARVGIVPQDVLTKEFLSVQQVAGDRLIAGLGIGDKLSRHENDAYGVGLIPREKRLAMLEEQCEELKKHGIDVWLGGKSDEMQRLAIEHGVALNVWESDPRAFRAPAVTWGGRVAVDSIAAEIEAKEQAGATWAVLLVNGSGENPVAAVHAVLKAIDH